MLHNTGLGDVYFYGYICAMMHNSIPALRMKKLLYTFLMIAAICPINAFGDGAPRLVTFVEYDADNSWPGIEFEDVPDGGWVITSITMNAYEPYSSLSRFAIAVENDGDWMAAPKFYTQNGSLHPDENGVVEAPLLYAADGALHPMEIDPGTYRIEISKADGDDDRTITFTTLTETALSSPIVTHPYSCYTLQGQCVENPSGGLFIIVDNTGAHKVRLR